MAKHYYNSGEFNLYCDVCAKKIKAHESKLRWDGLRVCTDDWEERQPQDFVRARQDKISIPFSRPVENTSNNISYGMWDRVTLRESNNILSVLFSNDINETLPITEQVFLWRAVSVSEIIPITEVPNFVVQNTPNYSDVAIPHESGEICILDYVDYTYFAEVYIGTCTQLNNNIIGETVSTSEVGSLLNDPYIDPTYFLSDYVGAIIYFNP